MVQTWDVTKWGFVVVDETVISVIGVGEASDWLVFWLVSQPAVHEWSQFYSDSAGLRQKYEFCSARRVVGSLDSQLMNVVALSLQKKTKSALKSSLRMYDKINGSLHRSHLNYWGLQCTFVLLFCWSRRCTFNYKMLSLPYILASCNKCSYQICTPKIYELIC